ncbi:hypothetical protein SUGI_0391820 [Cryptomeria japonica]|nr:hypothetical protein SUGI_0391820 [Cryptomeria japonica]
MSIYEVVVSKVKSRKVHYISRWDEQIQKNWELLKVLIGFSLGGRRDRRTVRWRPLKEGWVKLNFDGAMRGNLRESGYGCLIRDDRGHCLWAMCGYLGSSTNNHIEMEVMRRGFQLCVLKGLCRVEIEGRDWCDGFVYEAVISPLVDILDSREKMNLRKRNFGSEEEDEEVENIKLEKQRKRSFIEEAWEVYRVGVLNNNLAPFQRMLDMEDNWLSEASTGAMVEIGEKFVIILQYI